MDFKEQIFFIQEDFTQIMKNLPVPVEVTFFPCQSNSLSRLIDIERQDADIEEMFAFADTDGDGSLSFQEFEVQCTLDLGSWISVHPRSDQIGYFAENNISLDI